MTYTLKLVALECLQAQEIDGDEIYLKLNDQRIWASDPDKMGAADQPDPLVSQYDFTEGRRQTRQGWLPISDYQSEQFVFRNQSGDGVLQLWEADPLTRDDLLGQTPLSEQQAVGGTIAVVFQRSGAHYRLTYQIEIE